MRTKSPAPPMSTVPPPTRSVGTSRRTGLKFTSALVVVAAIAWWFLNHPISQARYVVLGVTVAALLAWLREHHSNDRNIALVLIEWSLVAVAVVTLMGGMAPQAPPADGKTPKHTTAGEGPAGLGSGLATTCRKVDSCAQLLDWMDEQRKAMGERAGMVFGKGR